MVSHSSLSLKGLEEAVILSGVLERFKKKSAITVMAQTGMARALDSKWIDTLFEQHSNAQYTRELLFSTTVDLMSLVSLGLSPSVHAAAKSMGKQLSVAVQSVYNKLNGMEPQVVRALVSGSAERLVPVVQALEPKRTAIAKGFRLHIVDGNHLAASEKRLKPLRKFRGAALPGQSLVVYDPELGLVLDVLPCEDAHTQERLLMQSILTRAVPGELWLADRNFCTAPIILGLIRRETHFLIREHAANPNPVVVSKLRRIGQIETGTVYEQTVGIEDDNAVSHRLRRIEVHLKTATEDGERIIRFLSNVPTSKLSAQKLAQLYRSRWRIEAMFQRLEAVLQSEIKALGQPRAALFAFGVAVLAYNILSMLLTAVRVQHANTLEKNSMELSVYYIALEIRANHAGMMIATDANDWQRYESLSTKEFAKTLLALAEHINPQYLRSYPRKPKVRKKKGYVSKKAAQKHIATSRVIDTGHVV
jgi:IS4 transposase